LNIDIQEFLYKLQYLLFNIVHANGDLPVNKTLYSVKHILP